MIGNILKTWDSFLKLVRVVLDWIFFESLIFFDPALGKEVLAANYFVLVFQKCWILNLRELSLGS